jgi:dihydrofolate synthase/folylpolyglutamate synthase
VSFPSNTILDRLLELHPKKIDLALGRMQKLLARLRHPERKLPPVIHVAGTNGKGSTIAFMRTILEAAGYQVHSYTSPHLVRFHERIRLAGDEGKESKPISETALARYLDACEQANKSDPITFFEITTAAALLAFADRPADIVLLEVGLGGRFDATNVIDHPRISVITHVDHDHHDFLGSELTQIAREKAGIIKKGVPAVIGRQLDEALDVIEQKAREESAPLTTYGQDFMTHEEGGRLIYQDDHGLLDLPLPKLAGHHQYENAGTAVAALRRLEEFAIPHEAFVHGVQNAHWPARCQPISSDAFGLSNLQNEPPEIWLDGGHNPNAASALAHAMAEQEDKVSRGLYLIVGMLNNKEASAFLEHFKTLANTIVAVPISGQENAYKAEELETLARGQGFAAHAAPDVKTALARVLDMNKAADKTRAPRILICGSSYLAGEVLALTESELSE